MSDIPPPTKRASAPQESFRPRHFERSPRSEKSLFLFASPPCCHPERSGPIFPCAPNYGASGRAVEGSAFLLPPISPLFPLRICEGTALLLPPDP
jgi:hypothetical protein